MAHHSLEPIKIVSSLEKLEKRIEERFPKSGLKKVCRLLVDAGALTAERAEKVAQPIISLRIICWMLIAVIILGLVTTIFSLATPAKPPTFLEFVQILEAGINDVVLIGAAIFFLFTLEARIRRRTVLRHLHELRSLAHVIDMHQLTKDPERLLGRGKSTKSSPESKMTAFELSRYLDYCSEMLSLIGKLAAIYAQNFDDPVALASVNEVESLTTSLSRKIWQKLMIVHSIDSAA